MAITKNQNKYFFIWFPQKVYWWSWRTSRKTSLRKILSESNVTLSPLKLWGKVLQADKDNMMMDKIILFMIKDILQRLGIVL